MYKITVLKQYQNGKYILVGLYVGDYKSLHTRQHNLLVQSMAT